MVKDRYLVCAPLGGLNDNLCQIEKCWAYAERWGRKLYVHSRYSSLQRSIWDFFEEQPGSRAETEGSIVLYEPDRVPWNQNRCTVKPASVLNALRADAEPGLDAESGHWTPGAFINALSRQRHSFDFGHDHPEDVLVHMNWGGGTGSFSLAERIRFKASVRDEVLARLSHLPSGYVSLHIRCTDMKSDYKAFLRERKNRLAGRDVLVCSDNQKVVDFAAQCLSSSRVHTTAGQRSTDGVALHKRVLSDDDMEKMRAATLDALTDLVALARGVEIDVAPTYRQIKGSWKHRLKRNTMQALGIEKTTQVSGFSQLAQFLCLDTAVRDRFLNQHETEPAKGMNRAEARSDGRGNPERRVPSRD